MASVEYYNMETYTKRYFVDRMIWGVNEWIPVEVSARKKCCHCASCFPP